MPDNEKLYLEIDPSAVISGKTITVRSLAEIRAAEAELTNSIGRGAAAQQAAQSKTSAAVVQAARNQQTAMQQLQGVSSQVEQALTSVAGKAAAVWAGLKAVRGANEVLQLAARYETLGKVMEVVGHNAKMSDGQMAGLEAALRRTGISAIQSRQNISRMVQAELDLSRASDLARVAQDAAVIANRNSSEAFERLVFGISSGQTRILRTLGLFVNFEQAYDKFAAGAGKAVSALTEEEKLQVRMNEALRAGTQIQGAYEASMETAGKQMLSAQRYAEDLKVSIGTAFQPAYTAGVKLYVGALKGLNENLGLVLTAAAAVASALAANTLAPFVSGVVAAARGLGTLLVAQRASTAESRAAAVAAFENAKLLQEEAASALAAEEEKIAGLKTEIAMRKENALAITQEQIALAKQRAVGAPKIGGSGGKVLTDDQAAAAANAALLAKRQKELELATRSVGEAQLVLEARTIATATAQRSLSLSTVLLTGAQKALNGVLAFVTANPFLVAVTALAAAYTYFATRVTETERVTDKYADTLEKVRTRLLGVADATDTLTVSQRNARIVSEQAKIQTATEELAKWRDEVRFAVPATFALSGATVEFNGALGKIAIGLHDQTISAANAAAQVTELARRFPQFAQSAESFQKVVLAGATLEQVINDGRDAVAKLDGTLGPFTQSMYGVTEQTKKWAASQADVNRTIAGARDILSQQATIEAKTTIARKEGEKGVRAFDIALQSWNEQMKDAKDNGDKTSLFTVDFAKALKSSDVQTRATAQSYLAMGRALTANETALAGVLTAEDKRKKALEDLKKQIKEATAADVELANTRITSIGDLRRSVEQLQSQNAALAKGRVEFAKVAEAQEIENEVRKIAGKVTGAYADQVRTLIVQERALKAAIEARLSVKEPPAKLTIRDQDAQQLRQAADQRIQYIALLREKWEKTFADMAASSDKVAENLFRGLQEAGSKFFRDLFTDGFRSAQDFVKSLRDLFVNVFAELASKKLMSKALGAFSMAGLGGKGSALDPSNFSKISDASFGVKGGKLAALGQGLGAAGAGAAIGYGLGYGTGNKTVGVLGGAAGGAAAGAAIGGVPGAIIGGIAGAVGGWLGASKKAKEMAKAMKEAQILFEQSLDAFRRTAKGTNNAVADALKANIEQQKALRDEANKAMAGKKNETKRNAALSEIDSLAKQNAQRIKDEFGKSIEAAINSLSGNEAVNKRADIEAAYAENLRSAAAAGVDASRVTELYRLQTEQLTKELEKEARAKENAAATLAEELDIRQKALSGDDAAAEAARVESQRRQQVASYRELYESGEITKEMFDQWVKLLDGEAKKALEDYAAAQKKAVQSAEDELRIAGLVADGKSREAEDLQNEINWRNRLEEARKLGLEALAVEVEAKQRAAIEAQRAAEKQSGEQDLRVQILRVQGRNEEADAMELEIRQAERLKKARELGLEALAEELSAEEKAALARNKAAEVAAGEQDLKLLILRSQGRDEEADAMELEIRQAERLAKAKELGLEQLALEANAAESAAIAQAKLEEATKKAAQAAQAASDAQASLAERLLRATGKTEEADKFAFDEKQREEWKKFLEDFGPDSPLLDELKRVQDAERLQFLNELAQKYHPGASVSAPSNATNAFAGPLDTLKDRLTIHVTINGDVSTTDLDSFSQRLADAVTPEIDRLLGTRLKAEQRRSGSTVA